MFCPCARKDEAKYWALSLQLLPVLQVHLHPLHLPMPLLVLVAVLMAAVVNTEPFLELSRAKICF